jgi:cytochrome c551/c552
MIKVLAAALVGTVVGALVMVVVIALSGTTTTGASSLGLGSLPLSTASTASSSSGSSSTGSSSSASGGAAAGESVFASAGCGGCHTFAPVGATGSIGPNLVTAYQSAKTDHNMSVAAFIKQCITSPATFIPAGYQAGIMPSTFATSLTASQIADLVALITQNQSG